MNEKNQVVLDKVLCKDFLGQFKGSSYISSDTVIM